MNRIHRLTAASLIGLGFLSTTAIAQSPPPEVPELEVEYLVNEGEVEVKILEIDSDARTLTVEVDETQETATLLVPEDADIIRTFPNNIQREIELSDLSIGDDIMIQGVEVDGVVHITIVGVAV
jgi:hypothetical protein